MVLYAIREAKVAAAAAAAAKESEETPAEESEEPKEETPAVVTEEEKPAVQLQNYCCTAQTNQAFWQKSQTLLQLTKVILST